MPRRRKESSTGKREAQAVLSLVVWWMIVVINILLMPGSLRMSFRPKCILFSGKCRIESIKKLTRLCSNWDCTVLQVPGDQRWGERSQDEEEEMWGPDRDVQPSRLDPTGRLACRHPQCRKHLLVQCRHPGWNLESKAFFFFHSS